MTDDKIRYRNTGAIHTDKHLDKYLSDITQKKESKNVAGTQT